MYHFQELLEAEGIKNFLGAKNLETLKCFFADSEGKWSFRNTVLEKGCGRNHARANQGSDGTGLRDACPFGRTAG